MIVKMIQDLRSIKEEQIGKILKKIKKDLEELKNEHTEVNKTVTEMEKY